MNILNLASLFSLIRVFLRSTKRFNFRLDRNSRSHKSGANTFTIGNTATDTSITMTVREATAMSRFLNSYLSNNSSTGGDTGTGTGTDTDGRCRCRCRCTRTLTSFIG